ncbi:MAG: hypothetical protein ACTSXY_04325, partial [Promethearchaeota archaeon]
KLSKAVQDLLFLPDFTARAIGLEAEMITEKQARAKLKKILTGLEIRRGLVLKRKIKKKRKKRIKYYQMA